jgi:hypothetical protein
VSSCSNGGNQSGRHYNGVVIGDNGRGKIVIPLKLASTNPVESLLIYPFKPTCN